MCKIYKVDTPAEALELARKFQKEQTYDLFRGQNKDWPLIASIYRLSSEEIEEARERLHFFRIFLSIHKSTARYAQNPNDVIAIAQHYGIPTDFIDFSYSPEIALFFATHSVKNLKGKKGVIKCLNKKDFESDMELLKVLLTNKKLIPPYLFHTKIESLWRLQAQQGCFLQLMPNDFEAFYPLDKIVFTHDGKPGNIPETAIYPKEKSDLEIILDNYFAAERVDEGAKRIEKFATEMGIPVTHLPHHSEYKYVKLRKAHKSWQASKTKAWEYKMEEALPMVKSCEFEFSIKCSLGLDKDTANVEKQLTILFQENKITRRKCITPHIYFTPRLRSMKASTQINKNVKNIWDGMRNLPYTRKQIIHSIAKYLVLSYYHLIKRRSMEECFYNPILIEMSDLFDTPSKCLVSGTSLLKAIREDILTIQADSLPKVKSTELLLYAQKVKVVFDFSKLTRLFAEEIIPSQMIRCHSDRPALFFSPIYIDRLGYA